MLRDYHVKDYETIKYAFYKVVAIVNAVQAVLIVAFYKLRDIYTHM